MFTAIAIDDEKKALDRFEHIMLDEPRLYLAGKFTSANEALAFTSQIKIDVAFLDIDMPGIDGLTLAEKLLAIRPRLEIIFVTAYDQYALSAFRLHAAGYLLKPISLKDLREQVDVLVRRRGDEPLRMQTVPLVVRCFGPLQCYPEGIEDRPVLWRTSKTEELFALLVLNRDIAVAREIIIEYLWPEADPEKAANRFRVTCTYLRNTLAASGYPDMLLRERDSYRIDMQRIRCDLAQLTMALPQTVAGANTDQLEKAGRLCAAPFLENKNYEWVAKPRRIYEYEFKRIQYRLADECLQQKNPGKYVAALSAILDRDPCEEPAVTGLISHRLQSGETEIALRLYNDYIKVLDAELGVGPSEKLRALMHR